MSEKRNLGSIYIPPVPDGEKEIIDLINRLGVVQDNQIAKLLCVKPSEMDSFLYYMDDLYTKKDRFEIDGHLIYARTKDDRPPKSPGVVECLWDVINRIERIDLSLVERAEHPADIFYIRTTTRQEEEKDGSMTEKEIHEVVVDTFIHEKNLHLVPYLQERYFARVSRDASGNTHGHLINNIVVNDMDIAEQILDTYELLVPSVFTLVDHSNIDSNGRPKVSYFKAE